jgi:hypothetical protein
LAFRPVVEDGPLAGLGPLGEGFRFAANLTPDGLNLKPAMRYLRHRYRLLCKWVISNHSRVTESVQDAKQPSLS